MNYSATYLKPLSSSGSTVISYDFRGSEVVIKAWRADQLIGEPIIAPRSYFYGLISKKAADIYSLISQLDFRAGSAPTAEEDDEGGDWERRLFAGENGLVMFFSAREQFCLKIIDEVIERIEAGLTAVYIVLKSDCGRLAFAESNISSGT